MTHQGVVNTLGAWLLRFDPPKQQQKGWVQVVKCVPVAGSLQLQVHATQLGGRPGVTGGARPAASLLNALHPRCRTSARPCARQPVHQRMMHCLGCGRFSLHAC